jgi:hypothetical protein
VGGAAGGGWGDDVLHDMLSSSPGTASAAPNLAPRPTRRRRLQYQLPGALAQQSGRSDLGSTGVASSKLAVLLEQQAGQEALSLLRPPEQGGPAAGGVQLERVPVNTRARSRFMAEAAKRTEEERRRIAREHGS